MRLKTNLKKTKNNVMFIFLEKKIKKCIFLSGFFRFLFLFVFIPLLCSCYGVHSKYGREMMNDKKICLFVNIYNEDHRNYLNKLKEYPNVGEFPDCDYLLYSTIDFTKTSQATVSGVFFIETIKASAYYKLYKFNSDKSKEILSIINNPDTVSFKKSTGILNSSLIDFNSSI